MTYFGLNSRKACIRWSGSGSQHTRPLHAHSPQRSHAHLDVKQTHGVPVNWAAPHEAVRAVRGTGEVESAAVVVVLRQQDHADRRWGTLHSHAAPVLLFLLQTWYSESVM